MFPKVRIHTMVCVMVIIMAFVVLEQTSGVEILDCGPGTPLVVEETTKHFDINCINIHQGFEVFWYLNWTQDNGPMHMKVVHCFRKTLCLKYLPYVGVQRTPYTVALDIAGFIKFFHLTRVTCTERSRYGTQENSYTCDIIIKSVNGHRNHKE
ncbi:uncharacterized protein LOC112569531 [Pomacea canaliculata]|uniref:uncharacterized protein LOC112569531 n=1 Tax=Pomacea canaliculata TaxID=400727 RepID=UPI000D7395C1|nr:uncharacterized protein LOC112569531 [Pomacea canaliculata]